jgi:hypothetical protein
VSGERERGREGGRETERVRTRAEDKGVRWMGERRIGMNSLGLRVWEEGVCGGRVREKTF